jgi:hypothetical protein
VNKNKEERGNIWWNNKKTQKKKTFMIKAFDLETGFGEKTIWIANNLARIWISNLFSFVYM